VHWKYSAVLYAKIIVPGGNHPRGEIASTRIKIEAGAVCPCFFTYIYDRMSLKIFETGMERI
jgi:hypothetical protein